MTKNLLALALLIGLAGSASAASNTNPQQGLFDIPQDKNTGSPDLNRKWSAPSVATVVETTTASNPFDGVALITGVCVTTAPAAAYDSSAAAGAGALGYTVIRDSDTANAVSNSSIVHQQAAVSVSLDAIDGSGQRLPGLGCYDFPGDGLPVSTGIVITNSNASIITVVRYRKLRVP